MEAAYCRSEPSGIHVHCWKIDFVKNGTREKEKKNRKDNKSNKDGSVIDSTATGRPDSRRHEATSCVPAGKHTRSHMRRGTVHFCVNSTRNSRLSVPRSQHFPLFPHFPPIPGPHCAHLYWTALNPTTRHSSTLGGNRVCCRHHNTWRFGGKAGGWGLRIVPASPRSLHHLSPFFSFLLCCQTRPVSMTRNENKDEKARLGRATNMTTWRPLRDGGQCPVTPHSVASPRACWRLGGADSRKEMEPRSSTRGQPSFVPSLSHYWKFQTERRRCDPEV